MQLALIRHLPTVWNKRGVLQGKRNIELLPISPDLKKAIERNKYVIQKQQPFEFVLTSTLLRTQQTARLYGFKDYIVEPLLDELDFGAFEGKEKKLLLERHGDKWLFNPEELVLGESLKQFEERIITFIKKYQHASRILVFGHGSWIRAISSLHNEGTINAMNQLEVENNKLILLNF